VRIWTLESKIEEPTKYLIPVVKSTNCFSKSPQNFRIKGNINFKECKKLTKCVQCFINKRKMCIIYIMNIQFKEEIDKMEC
jgi:hypothetical protein